MNCLEWVDLNMFEIHGNNEKMNSMMVVENNEVDNDHSDGDDALNCYLNDNIDRNSRKNLKAMTRKDEIPNKLKKTRSEEQHNESNQPMRRCLTRSSESIQYFKFTDMD